MLGIDLKFLNKVIKLMDKTIQRKDQNHWNHSINHYEALAMSNEFHDDKDLFENYSVEIIDSVDSTSSP